MHTYRHTLHKPDENTGHTVHKNLGSKKSEKKHKDLGHEKVKLQGN